jgi:hypothetical protein
VSKFKGNLTSVTPEEAEELTDFVICMVPSMLPFVPPEAIHGTCADCPTEIIWSPQAPSAKKLCPFCANKLVGELDEAQFIGSEKVLRDMSASGMSPSNEDVMENLQDLVRKQRN